MIRRHLIKTVQGKHISVNLMFFAGHVQGLFAWRGTSPVKGNMT
jgi:hypothetical protein